MSQKRTLGVLLAAAALLPLAAQSQTPPTPAECAALIGNEAGDGLKAVKCVGVLAGGLQAALDRISDLETKFSALKRSVESIDIEAALAPVRNDFDGLRSQLANTVPAIGNAETTKAIVAYFSLKGERTCPEGWSPYEEAKNRFIVGASTDVYTQVGGRGGEANVILTEPQMPNHRHAIPLVTGNVSYSDAGEGANSPYFDYRNRASNKLKIVMPIESEGVGASGGNQPHNNIPPYIALYFCKKNDPPN